MKRVIVSGIFDDIRSKHLRFLEEAAKQGPVTVLLWDDATAAFLTGTPPRLGLSERMYYLEAVRWVSNVVIAPGNLDPNTLPESLFSGSMPCAIWAATDAFGRSPDAAADAKAAFCAGHNIGYLELGAASLSGFPSATLPADSPRKPGKKRVVVTGCFDWLHTGHVRFFEEASSYGELTVIVGHDANIRLLKGEGHPLFSEAERRYAVGSIRHVARALVSSGSGWLDAEPEIIALGAERYIVNSDGDKPEKRQYCEEHGIEYIVLERTPAEGLPRRASTDLRGF
jgi:cytidyltransferase-like protein